MAFLKNNEENNNELVRVVVRCRPMNCEEILLNCTDVVKIDRLRSSVKMFNPKNDKIELCKEFIFDSVYNEVSNQSEIYDEAVRPLVEAVLDGFNGTVFAYGQSGAGKTYTMEGLDSGSNKGVLPRAFEHIFSHISNSCNMQYLVRTSYLEIYKDEIRDLLDIASGKKYELRENKHLGVYVKDLSSFVCKNEKEINMVVASGRENRTIGATNLNERSSRSHAIVTITIEMKYLSGALENTVRVGKLNLVDLAGSERQQKTHAEGDRLKEASLINLSLSALGNVISALSENRGHYIPYRDSKLTRILRNSLGGNSKTLMIANIGPASYNYDESLNTLRFASRAKKIKNTPTINEDPFDTLLRKYQEEIKRLKGQLAERTQVNKCYPSKSNKTCDTVTSVCNNKSNESQEHEKINGSLQETVFVSRKRCKDDKTKELHSEEVEKLTRRIQLMESRLLTGTSNFIEHTKEQEKVLEEQTNEINKIKWREREIQESLEKEIGITEEMKDEYCNLEQEVETKSKKLLKLYKKLQTVQQDIKDAMEEFNADRRELELTKHEILKEIKLKYLIMENFIPKELRRQVLDRLYYNEELDNWQFITGTESAKAIIRKPQNTEHMRKPTTLYTAFTRRKADHIFKCDRTEENRQITFRFKGEDILDMDLIVPSRITKDYKSPKIPPALNSMLQSALYDYKYIDINVGSKFSNCKSLRSKSGETLQSGNVRFGCRLPDPRRTQSAANLRVYPKPRGLVPK